MLLLILIDWAILVCKLIVCMIAEVGYPSPLTFLQRPLDVKFDWRVGPNSSRQLIAYDFSSNNWYRHVVACQTTHDIVPGCAAVQNEDSSPVSFLFDIMMVPQVCKYCRWFVSVAIACQKKTSNVFQKNLLSTILFVSQDLFLLILGIC